MKKLTIEVVDISGICPVYKVGDRLVIDDGYKLNLKETTNVCMHSLTSILPYYIALSKGVNPVELGLTKKDKPGQHKKKAYIQCLDPCKYTGGGTVVFEITTS